MDMLVVLDDYHLKQIMLDWEDWGGILLVEVEEARVVLVKEDMVSGEMRLQAVPS
jgi:hypothetical protein